MTAAVAPAGAAVRPAPAGRPYRFELVKLVAQWRVRALLVACWTGPGLLVAVVSRQSSLPADTVFGRWMGQSGWAGPLVVLAFACSWVLPLVTSLVAGDFFNSRKVDPQAMNHAIIGLQLLKDAEIPVVAIEGNHDQHDAMSSFSWMRSLSQWGYLKLLEPARAPEGGFALL